MAEQVRSKYRSEECPGNSSGHQYKQFICSQSRHRGNKSSSCTATTRTSAAEPPVMGGANPGCVRTHTNTPPQSRCQTERFGVLAATDQANDASGQTGSSSPPRKQNLRAAKPNVFLNVGKAAASRVQGSSCQEPPWPFCSQHLL